MTKMVRNYDKFHTVIIIHIKLCKCISKDLNSQEITTKKFLKAFKIETIINFKLYCSHSFSVSLIKPTNGHKKIECAYKQCKKASERQREKRKSIKWKCNKSKISLTTAHTAKKCLLVKHPGISKKKHTGIMCVTHNKKIGLIFNILSKIVKKMPLAHTSCTVASFDDIFLIPP